MRTVVEPVRCCGQCHALAAHRKREDLAWQDPSDRSIVHTIGCREEIDATGNMSCSALVPQPSDAGEPPTHPADVHAAAVCAGQSSWYRRT